MPELGLRPKMIIGDFEVVALYPSGVGGMSTVVQARATKPTGLPNEVALKISKMGSTDTFYTSAIKFESELLSKLNAPGIVTIYPAAKIRADKVVFAAAASNLPSRPWYFIMERLQGGALQDLIKGVGKLSVGEAMAIAFKVSQALDYVHQQGYVHNDIKPENVIFRVPLVVGAEPDPVLIDFGIAARKTRLTEDGTLQYMSPERLSQARGEVAPEKSMTIDPAKADVWAMGILIYRMLAGYEPFDARTKGNLTTAIRSLPAESIAKNRPEIPREVDVFITEGCLAKQPMLRPSIRELSQLLRRYAGDGRILKVPKKGRWPW